MAKLKNPYLRELVVNQYGSLTTLISKWNYLANHKLKPFLCSEFVFPSQQEQKDLDKLQEINTKLDAMQTDFINEFGNYEAFLSIYADCERLNKCLKAKFKRLKNNIAKMLKEPCIFATFTFNDKTLENTTAETRRIYVVRALKATGARFVANIDYGSKNLREHYHALVQLPKVDRNIWSLEYGNIHLKKVQQTTTPKQLALYITKFTKHSLKSTTDHNIIYSR